MLRLASAAWLRHPAGVSAPAVPYVAVPPLLERLGVRYLQKLSAALPEAAATDAIHVLNADERRELRSVVRGAVFRAFLAGAISALVAAIGETILSPLILGPAPELATIERQLLFWAAFAPIVALAATGEIGFLYWDGLRSVHKLAHAAGLRLWPAEAHGDSYMLAAGLARAALEIPNPTDAVFGVDPRREASKLKLLVSSLLYKVKVGASNFVAKALIRRLLGRSVLRAWLAFTAIPITGLWDALIAWKVLREARIRAMGPSAIRELLEGSFADDLDGLSAPAKIEAIRAVGSAIVRSFDAHPNLVLLLRQLRRRLGEPALAVVDDTAAFLAGIAKLPRDEQSTVLRLLAVAAIIDGRLTRDEQRLVRDAQAACGRPPADRALRVLCDAFLAGDPIPPQQIRDLG